MSGIDFENIRPYYLRNLVMLINDGFISYDMITHKWVLMYSINNETHNRHSINYGSISDIRLTIELTSNNYGRLETLVFDYTEFRVEPKIFLNSIAHEHTDSIDLLVKNNFSMINSFDPRYFKTYSNSLGVQIYEMTSQIKRQVIDSHTLLCPASEVIDYESQVGFNPIGKNFDDETEKLKGKLKEYQVLDHKDEFDLMETETIDIDRFVAFSKTLPTANPNSKMISKEDKKRLDNISTIQEEINETYSEYIGRDIDFSPADGDTNTFVSEGDPFDVVIRYFIDKGILDRLEFNSGIYVTLKSHMVIGTDVFVEAGISELSLKNNIIKIKHMIGQEMHETKLELSFVFEKISSDDIYIRPFDMHKGKKIYTVKID